MGSAIEAASLSVVGYLQTAEKLMLVAHTVLKALLVPEFKPLKLLIVY